MKLVKEHINEKFTDESDPIKDMGIGFKDNISINDERNKYLKTTEDAIKKVIKQFRIKKSIELRKKLIGKIISGRFINMKTYNYINKTFRISKIRISYNSYSGSDQLYNLKVYSSKGKWYELIIHENYELTM